MKEDPAQLSGRLSGSAINFSIGASIIFFVYRPLLEYQPQDFYLLK